MFTFCNDYKASTYIVSLGIAGQFSSTWAGSNKFLQESFGNVGIECCIFSIWMLFPMPSCQC